MSNGIMLAIRQRLERVNWEDVANRSVRTFWQTAGAALVIVLTTSQDWRSALVLAGPPVAAGLSAVWNIAIRPALKEVAAP